MNTGRGHRKTFIAFLRHGNTTYGVPRSGVRCIFASSSGGGTQGERRLPCSPGDARSTKHPPKERADFGTRENIMAILTGINTRLRKSAGDWTFSRNQSTTIAMQKVEKKAVPVRTNKQMTRRMGWANIVSMWSSFTGNLRPSFEKKGPRHSDFNAFMAANLAVSKVYLKRNEVRLGVCVAAPYVMSIGTLPSIGVISVSGGKMRSDIALGDLSIDADTTVAAFSKAVLENNSGYLEGDQITGFLAQQLIVGDNQIPKVEMIASRVRLDTTESTKLMDVVSEELFSSTDGYLSSKSVVNGGIAWIHSRLEKGKTRVSAQHLMVNNSLLDHYMSDAARTEAIESYGGLNKNEYLTPTDTAETVQNP